MSEFDFLRNVTIGQYLPTGSPIHRLDPRAKLLGGLLLVLAIALADSLLEALLGLTLVLLLARLARVPAHYLWRGVRLALPILLLVLGLSLLFRGWQEPSGEVFLEWGWLRFTRFSVWITLLALVRIVALIFLTSLLTLTSTTTELTHGLERLLHPFRRLGLPSHELALVNMIALRFVPTLAEEMERVMKAQASRGADFTRKFYRPDKAARAYLPLIVPLFVNSLRRAEELVSAMEARCYLGGEGRTRFVVLEGGVADVLAVLGCFAYFLASFWIQWPSLMRLLFG